MANCFDSGMRLNDEINVSNLIFDRMHAHTKRVPNGRHAEGDEVMLSGRLGLGRQLCKKTRFGIYCLDSLGSNVRETQYGALILFMAVARHLVPMEVFCVVF